MARQVNYYEVLGVGRNASQAEIRDAYRRLAKERHPDRPGGNQREFSRLQEAHDVLSDPGKRRQHDQDLDLAHAESQLSDLSDSIDWSQLEDEVSAKRNEREGPGLGQRLREKFRRGEQEEQGGRSRGRGRRREAKWYEPHEFDPDPINPGSAGKSFLFAFVAFLVLGQLGLWAAGYGPQALTSWATVLGPFMLILYTVAGLAAAYYAYRLAGYAAVGLAFVAGLIIDGAAPQEFLQSQGFLQSIVVGMAVFLVLIYLGNRRTSRR